MSRGVLFALNAEDGEKIAEAESDEDVMAVIQRLEGEWDRSWAEELGPVWDPLHRCLSDGTLAEDGGDYPLSFAVFGGEPVYDGDDYIVRYVDTEEVVDVADALNPLDEPWLRERYNGLDSVDHQSFLGESDLMATVAALVNLQNFYQRAAAAGRAVIFTAGR
jgi:Domain of unknown function (DUF1877)